MTTGEGTLGLDEFELDDETVLALPPRRRRLPFATAALGTCVAVGVGVVGGIAIQKHWGGSSTSGNGRAAALAALSGSNGAAARARFGGGGNGATFARAGTAGQVKAIDGKNLYVTDTQGNTIKVTTSAATTVRVTSSASLRKVKPGDFVVVQGTQTKAGYAASSVTDSGTQGGFGGGGLSSGSGAATSSGSGTGFGAGTGFGGSK